MHLFCLNISLYGLMLLLSLVVGNVIVFLMRKRLCVSFDNTILMEAYMLLGAIIGSKTLYVAISYKSIDWKNVFSSIESFSRFLNSGFVFYGGLLGALLLLVVAGAIHRKSFFSLLESVAFIIPLMHSIGRIGCLLGGCCYGIPYSGPLAVSYSWSDVSRFPVQLLEAILLLLLFNALFIYRLKEGRYSLEIYLVSYSIIRFFTEFMRGDEVRGVYFKLSLSQWISILMLVFSFLLLFTRKQIAKRMLR